MAEYEIRYQLNQKPRPCLDGSGCIAHHVWADYRLAGSQDSWTSIPDKYRVVYVPVAELQAALAAGTNQQIVAAYKDALVANLDTQPEPIMGWTSVALEALLDANDAAQAAANAANVFITETLSLVYPVRFTL